MRLAGPLAAIPIALVLLAGFAVPIVLVALLSIMPPRTFALDGEPTLANYIAAFTEGYAAPLAWSLAGALLTTLITLLLATALRKLGGRWGTIAAILIALPIFVSESVRLFGLSLFMMPGGGILAGSVNAFLGVKIGSIMNTKLAALVGLVYIHFPFMLFPTILGLSLVSQDQVAAARDLGASRWQTFREIEAPLAAPGVAIGVLLTFVLALGANAEAAILGGRAVVVVSQAIEQRFSYAQDWPLGAALTVLVIIATAALVFPVLSRIDLDRLIRR